MTDLAVAVVGTVAATRVIVDGETACSRPIGICRATCKDKFKVREVGRNTSKLDIRCRPRQHTFGNHFHR